MYVRTVLGCRVPWRHLRWMRPRSQATSTTNCWATRWKTSSSSASCLSASLPRACPTSTTLRSDPSKVWLKRKKVRKSSQEVILVQLNICLYNMCIFKTRSFCYILTVCNFLLIPFSPLMLWISKAKRCSHFCLMTWDLDLTGPRWSVLWSLRTKHRPYIRLLGLQNRGESDYIWYWFVLWIFWEFIHRGWMLNLFALCVASGLCCKDCAAEASQPDPGSSWHREDCHLCHHCLPPCSSGQRVRQNEFTFLSP